MHGWLVDPQVTNPGPVHIAFRSNRNGNLCMIRTSLIEPQRTKWTPENAELSILHLRLALHADGGCQRCTPAVYSSSQAAALPETYFVCFLQDKETAAAIGNKSYNALTERMVALTGRSSLTPAASQDNPALAHQAAPALSAAADTAPAVHHAPVVAVPGAEASGEGSTGQSMQSAGAGSVPLEAPPPQATANANAVKGAGLGDSTALEGIAPKGCLNPACPNEAHGAAEVSGAAGETAAPVAVQQATASAEGESAMTGASAGGLSEADELALAVELSLHESGNGVASASERTASMPATSASPLKGFGEESLKQTNAEDQAPTPEPAGDLLASADHFGIFRTAKRAAAAEPGVPMAEQLSKGDDAPAGIAERAANTQSAQHADKADMLDHDFVVVHAEDAPGMGFEQVSMPKMPSSSPGSAQDLTEHVPPTAETLQLGGGKSKKASETPAGSCVSEPPSSIRTDPESHDAAAAAAPAPGAGSSPSEPDMGSSGQQAPALNAEALALLAALPKPRTAQTPYVTPAQPGLDSKAAGTPSAEPLQCPARPFADKLEDLAPTEDCHDPMETDATHSGAATSGLPSRPEEQSAGLACAGMQQPQQTAKLGANKEAFLIQAFLDNASSQLTEHGLLSLHQVGITVDPCPAS